MTFVLVHGGGFDRRCWELLEPMLETRRPVLSVDLPGREPGSSTDVSTVTLGQNAACVVAEIERRDLSEVILVAHSVAGVTVPRVMNLIPERLAHVVFVSAVIPPDGTRVLDQIDPDVRAAVEQSIGDGIYAPDEDALRAMLCADMDETQIEFTLSRAVPDSAATLAEHVDVSGLVADVPRTYVQLSRDCCYPPDLQTRSATLAGGDAAVIESGHMVMIEHPRLLAEILMSVAPER